MSTILMSQDVHFTYFTFAPQSYNPSLIGGYSGTYRGSAILRDQYNNGDEVHGYQTIEANVDAPIIKGFRDQDWFGAGISFNRDTRGFVELKDNISRLGLAYHIGLDKKSNSYFSIGAQFVNSNRTIGNKQGLTSAEILTPGLIDVDKEQYLEGETSFSDWVAGFSYTSKSKKGNYKVGLSASQFLENKIGFKTNFDDPFKLVGFFQMFQMMNKKLAIEPAILFQSIGRGGGFEVTAHNMFSYKLKPESPLRLKAGLGLRTGSFSAQALLGASYKGFHGGFSYDLPVNGYQKATGSQYALEFAIGYIGVIAKTPKPEPIILCPRL